MKKLAIAACVALLASCAQKPQGWSVTGSIEGAGDTTLTLQGFNNGQWYTIDSIHTRGGDFTYNAPEAGAFPDIYRLGLGEEYIYFPADSVDKVNVITTLENFGSNYKLSGTEQAATVNALDSILNHSVSERGAAITVADKALKGELFARAFQDPSVLPIYYLLTKSVAGHPLFNANEPTDLRIYGAVAQRFALESPDDPRGQYIARIYTGAKAVKNATVQEITVPESGVIDFTRADVRGIQHSLAETAAKGNVVVLSFTSYDLENSPAYNVVLHDVYDKYKSQGVEIYQLSFDGDETQWKATAKNLPWIAVWNSTTDDVLPMTAYNLSSLPTTFIIDRTGTLAERVEKPSELEAKIKKYL